jgi:hypothetical protein
LNRIPFRLCNTIGMKVKESKVPEGPLIVARHFSGGWG